MSEALPREPSLQELPRTLLRVHSELARAQESIREVRESIQSYSGDRLRDTHARLSEVSSATEMAPPRQAMVDAAFRPAGVPVSGSRGVGG